MNLDIETEYWNQGKEFYGIDEAGTGSCAGSAFSAIVSFSPLIEIPKELSRINDSKKLTREIRAELAEQIKSSAAFFEIFEMTAVEIDAGSTSWVRFVATSEFMKCKIAERDRCRVVTMFDGNKALDLPGAQNLSLVKGDGKCFSVAAASILAKNAKDVRDAVLGEKFPDYGFEHHSGYLTKAHKESIAKYGLIPGVHRTTFVKI